MKQFYLVVFLFISVVLNSFSQKQLSDYSYVIVSEQFVFQDEKDKYQLNSLTKFLFNKNGFNAYFDREVPRNVDRCDGLWAEAEGSPGFIYTKVEVVLRDCNGKEVYRSVKGNSKVKNYKKAYYESMREAFISIKKLNVKQKDIDAVSKKEIIVNQTVAPEVVVVKKQKNKDDNASVLPSEKYTSYSYSNKSYLLRKTTSGYSFYEEAKDEADNLVLIGKIIITANSIEFLDLNKKKMKAYFDTSKNLIIGKDDDIVVYKIEN